MTYEKNEVLLTEEYMKDIPSTSLLFFIMHIKLYLKENKEQLVNNTIELIKNRKTEIIKRSCSFNTQKEQLEQLEKVYFVLIGLEVYKVNIDKFEDIEDIYRMLDSTIKNTFCSQKINLENKNVDLSHVINEVNEKLTTKGKEKISFKNEIENPFFI